MAHPITRRSTRWWHPAAMAVPALIVGLLATGCGDGDSNEGDGTTTSADGSTTTTSTRAASTTTTTSNATTTTAAPTTTTAGISQPAVWPAAGTVFATPEEAARSFVQTVLGVPPTLGEFQQGDSRSGEMPVLSPGEGGGTAVERGLLALRQLGSANGWFVLAAVNDVPTIEVPDTPVPAAKLRVTGTAIGFEATVIVSAWLPGGTTPLDKQVTQAGEMGVAGPFDVELDLSTAPAGSTVAIVVTGGVGLETDPGDFAAVPVTISG